MGDFYECRGEAALNTLKVLAVIPCYNEEKSIKDTVENLKQKAPYIDYVVVNDGSQDNTYQVCLDNEYPVIDFPINLGITGAVQAGMRYAHINGYDMAIQFDGDGQHLPEYIAEMVRLMQTTSANIVIGSRYINQTSKGLRGFGGALIRFAVKITTGKSLTDPTSGMRLFDRQMIDRFANNINYGPEPDTLVYLMRQGVTVLECPVTMQVRKTGKSYLSALASAKYMLHMFVSILIVQWFRIKREVSPNNLSPGERQ